MANTTNLNLEKPIGTDQALVSVINSNMDKIDNYAGSTNQALSKVKDSTVMTGVTSLALLKEKLKAVADQLAVNESIPFRFYCNFSDDNFTQGKYYSGNVAISYKQSDVAYYYNALVGSDDGDAISIGFSSGNTWNIHKLAMKSQIESLYTAYSNSWVNSLSVDLPKQGAYLFASQQYAQMTILMRFQNGNTSASNISGSNWTFTNGTNGNITATASNQADYYIIPLFPAM